MTLALYHSPYSTCSQKVRLVLAEKDLDFESHEMNFATEDHLSPDYLELNPNGVVPTLLHEGEAITDSSCIMEYLDEVFPEPRLLPETPAPRAKVRALLRYFEEVPTVAIRFPSFHHVFLPVISAFASQEQFDAGARKRPLRSGFYRKMNSGAGFEAADVEESTRQLQQTIDRLEGLLETRPWLTGESFGVADCCLLPLADRMDDLGMNGLWSERPGFASWLERTRARPSYAKAFYPGLRLSQRPEFEATLGRHTSGSAG
ncbi:MAG: glutathione S-transferase family protein [Myxococcota bacterium]